MARGIFFRAELALRKYWRDIPIFWKRAFGFLSAASFGVLTNKLSEGSGLVVFTAFALILFGAFVVHRGYLEAKEKNVSRLYWYWVGYSAVFLFTLLACKYVVIKSYAARNADQKSQLISMTNALVATNAFYSGTISRLNETIVKDNDLVEQARRWLAGKPVSIPYAQIAGFHDETNIISITNQISVFQTNVTISTNSLTLPIQSNAVVMVPFVFDYFQMQRLVAKFSALKPVPVVIFFHSNDPGGLIIARQICQVFLASKYQPVLRPLDGVRFPNNGVTVCSTGSLANTAMWPAFMELFGELGQIPQTDTETEITLLNGQIWILVTKNQN